MKALGSAALLLSSAVDMRGQTTVYALPSGYSTPVGIAPGPDGALWFLNFFNYYSGVAVGRITTSGLVTEYPLPNYYGTYPGTITTGPDGALWFTEPSVHKIGRITTRGVITEYGLSGFVTPYAITTGPDGALWFTEWVTGSSAGRIGRITTAGVVTEYQLPSRSAQGIAAGPDGALWFTEPCPVVCSPSTGEIGRITTSGVISEYLLPGNSYPGGGIAAGPDGALWFVVAEPAAIGRITPSGVITMYPVPNAQVFTLYAITMGPDGALWFPESSGIGRITTAGIITQYSVPISGNWDWYITTGPDGGLWTEDEIHITRLVPDATNPVSHVTPLPPAETVANFLVQWSGTDTGWGIYNFTIFVSDNNGPFMAWLTGITTTQATFSGVLGHTYGFYSIARDLAGNQETKSAADTTTYIAAAPGDLNGDGAVSCADINVIMASFGKSVGQPGYNPVADVNHDGVVNVKDLSWVSQYLIPGTQCQ